jgi:CubicO group peptidase (beta-lactamase class C family)
MNLFSRVVCTLALVLIPLIEVVVFAQSLDKAITGLIRTEIGDDNGPGGVFMVAQHGKPIFQKAFGKANLELDVPMNTANVFQIGSMTKQFTAVAILMLEHDGKLKIIDPVSIYIPDYPNGDNITIWHLLSHTAGIKDFTKMKGLQNIATKQMSNEQMVDFFKDEPVDFAPGEKFEYNNSGYVLLGYLIELVSGQPYQEFIEKRIFQAIGMTHSYFATDRLLIPNRAHGYHLKEYGYVNKTSINFSVPGASGSLMSNLEDLLKWQNALNRSALLPQEVVQKAFERNKLNDGTEITYGFGWHIRDIDGIRTWEHGGSIFGFKSMGVYIPSRDIYAVGLTNCDCFSPTQLTLKISELVLEFIPASN